MNQNGFATPIVCAIAIVLVTLGAPTSFAQGPDEATQIEFMNQYCVGCHSGGTVTSLVPVPQWADEIDRDLSNIAAEGEIWEEVIRKVRGRMMPPAGIIAPREEADAFVAFIANALDQATASNPEPGRKSLHRLNRTEYGNAVRDLFNLEIDATQMLPPDTSGSSGFDNVADVLGTEPALMNRYLAAAWEVTRRAVGDTTLAPSVQTFLVARDLAQTDYVEGLPLGTRGGLLAEFFAPVDGEYEINPSLMRSTTDVPRGMEFEHTAEISVDGERMNLATLGGFGDAALAVSRPARAGAEFDARMSTTVTLEAGPHEIGVAFLKQTAGMTPFMIQPFFNEIDSSWPFGIPYLKHIRVTGPVNTTGAGDSPSRGTIFTCHPDRGDEAAACAESILSRIARRAYRRPVTDSEVERLVGFYRDERDTGGNFDLGIQKALTYMLVTPQFLFRFETDPEGIEPDTTYRISDLELASRLSFFLWSTLPDEELLDSAIAGSLSQPEVLEQQVGRMLADGRANALINNFAAQWLTFRNLEVFRPDNQAFPDFDDSLRQSFLRETELLFQDIMRRDRPIQELLTADYTYLNERLAINYGIPDIFGDQFRRVDLSDNPNRKGGILDHGSILTVSSYPNRTSPVLRGKYILTNILGTPPPAPPENVPALEEELSEPQSMKERMEAHRANPACAGCHQLMDPIGLAMENYDGIGRWRTDDGGAAVDPDAGVIHPLQDYGPINGPTALGEALVENPYRFAQTATEKLLAYALGRVLQYNDMPVVREITGNARENDYRFSSFVMGVVSSVPFQMRVSTAALQSAAASDDTRTN